MGTADRRRRDGSARRNCRGKAQADAVYTLKRSRSARRVTEPGAGLWRLLLDDYRTLIT
jgi:hypothetical protein